MSALERLRGLTADDLRALHDDGRCPSPTDLLGTLDGEVLDTHLPRHLHPWRGKVVERRDDGSIGGRNRIGLGPIQVRRFRFTARTGPSLFGDRQVVLLDHDHPTNPRWIRRFHDELVEIEDGLYLATSHHGEPGRLKQVAFFSLAAPHT